MISTTNDPATPYQAGVDLAKQLGGTLLTFEGTQHTVVFQGNTCIDDIAAKYLLDVTVAAAGHHAAMSTQMPGLRTVTVRLRRRSGLDARATMIAMRRAGRRGLRCCACVLVTLRVLPAAWATPEGQSTETVRPTAIWGSCEQFVGDTSDIPTAQCGTVSVPVDYANPQAHRRNWRSSAYRRPATASAC